MTSITCTPRVAVDAGVPRTSGRYAIDASTSVEVRSRYAGLPVGGTFGGVTGWIDIPGDMTGSSAAVVVDTATFVPTGGPFAGVLRRRADVGSAPAVRFEASRMEPILESFVTHDGERPLWALVGVLSAGAVARPVRIAVGVMRVVDGGDAISFTGTTTLRCADLDIPRSGGLLSDTIRVRVAGVARRTVG